MDTHVQFSEIQLLNLSYLMAMQACSCKDLVAASNKYGVSAAQAQKVAKLGMEKIPALVANFGHECLCTPRDDLLQLLTQPSGVVVTFSGVSAAPQSASADDRRRMSRH